MEFVSVQFKYQYTTRDGNLVSIKPNERYILVSKTNEHWWHVRKDQNTKPFYIPAQYVKQIQSGDESVCNNKTVNTSDVTRRKSTTMNLLAAQDVSKDSHRFSTFGVCDKVLDLKPRETQNHRPDQTTGSSGSSLNKTQTHNSAGSFSLTSAPQKTNKPQPSAKPHPVSKVSNGQHQRRSFLQEDKTQQTLMEDEDMTFPPPPTSPLYNMIPEIHIQDFDSFSDLPPPPAPNQHSLSQTAEKTSSTEALHIERVEDESLRSAVYVNVAQLRQGTSESPPSAPSSYSPSYLDPEGWEVHTDQESGQEYYYHPATGRTTWDCPFLDSPTDPERFHREELCSPSPPQSPSLLSPSTASPSACTSDWEQLVDESSGRTYFYNPMSGETSWEPPEQLSPYPPLMEPMSVHRFHEDGPPPLPEEDYPPEDYPGADQPESYEEQSAAGPPTFPREYSLGHVSRTVIPRASLDRSTPAGWNLMVEPNGTWVFTSEHSPDEWIKSVDDRGQTYYYLRDGSKSQWTLPEAPAGPGQSRVENGVEAENLSVIKNWRHTVGPSQFSAAQDEARFVPTHRRNTSDYSSDSSSTGNSPEVHHNAFGFRPWRNPYYLTSRWLRYNVQNLEKAGILNKTKVSENGKKVRKNWAQAWTVLHGGVLTFHKDPKSAASGASNKTNQIVAEVTVDLHGASIGWASKDKSSKKNVLELKGKNGVEFLIQYDTESIINDWLKVITDTIRQLEYQDHHSEEEDTDLYEKIAHTERDDKFDKRKSTKPNLTSSSSSAGDADQKRVRTKLMKFLMKRPTLQSVKDKGYIRDNVFGCHLATLCAQERTTVPSFVEKCVRAVERRGLDIDGLYRVSGNLATIQRLRFKADHEELDLEDGQWEDVHVITGALKLFFRELPEPLFPFSFFNNFIATIRISEYKSKRSFMLELIRKLPGPNHDTMELLFGHLRRVIQYGDDNRMTVQNVAIVFGPTLLRPETESSNIAMHMVFQNQIVEFILNEYEFLFHSS